MLRQKRAKLDVIRNMIDSYTMESNNVDFIMKVLTSDKISIPQELHSECSFVITTHLQYLLQHIMVEQYDINDLSLLYACSMKIRELNSKLRYGRDDTYQLFWDIVEQLWLYISVVESFTFNPNGYYFILSKQNIDALKSIIIVNSRKRLLPEHTMKHVVVPRIVSNMIHDWTMQVEKRLTAIRHGIKPILRYIYEVPQTLVVDAIGVDSILPKVIYEDTPKDFDSLLALLRIYKHPYLCSTSK